MKEVNFTLTVQESNTILKALSKLPYEESASVIAKMQTQAIEQSKEKPAEEIKAD